MKLQKIIAVFGVLALVACAAQRTAWTLPADLTQGSAEQIVADACAAGHLGDLLEAAESTVFNSDEERMAEFLRVALATDGLDETQRATAEWMLHDVCEVNAPGTSAADFEFVTSTGNRSTMAAHLKGEPLALFFYDPDCDHCREVMVELTDLGEYVNVLAVCVVDDEARWQQKLDLLPADWVAVLDCSGIMINDTYVIRSMPSIYLLDSERKVVLKNPSTEKLYNTLTNK